MENQQNPANLGYGEIRQPSLPFDAHNQVQVDLENALRMRPLAPRPREYNSGNVNIIESDGPLVLPLFPPGITFLMTSSLMQFLSARGLFSGVH